jgi:glutathione S-transferase
MKLYYTSSVCSLAVRIIIHELGIKCDYESVNLKTKLTETSNDFLNINPKGTVPVLQLSDNSYLTENAIILQYLADKYNAIELLPSVGDSRRYRTLEWLNFVSTDLHRYCAPLFWSKIPNEVKENLFRPILNSKLSIVDQHLHNHKYLMGDQFTLPDSYLFVILIWVVKLKINLNAWPDLSRYFNEMKQRQSVRESLEEEVLIKLVK